MSLIKKCRSVDPNHLTGIGPTICCPPFFSFCVWKVSHDLRAPEGVVLFSFEVWLHIWKSMEEARKLWLMRTEQSQIVQSFDCSEWLCQWQLLKGQTCGLIFDLVLFVHLNEALVHNIKWYFSLTHHFEQFKFWCIMTSCSLRTTLHNLSLDAPHFSPMSRYSFARPSLDNHSLASNWWLASESISECAYNQVFWSSCWMWVPFFFIHHYLDLLSVILLFKSVSWGLLQAFQALERDQALMQVWMKFFFWLCLTPSHTSSLPAFLCNLSSQRYIPQKSIYIS